MGKITEYLINLIAKQVEDKGIVVWYDPEKVYTGVISNLTIPNTTILRCDTRIVSLRFAPRLSPFWNLLTRREGRGLSAKSAKTGCLCPQRRI